MPGRTLRTGMDTLVLGYFYTRDAFTVLDANMHGGE